MTAAAKKGRKSDHVLSARRLKMDWPLYLMMFIPVALVFVFNYIPMVGIVIAFEKYLPAKGILGSKWVGLKNFQTLFNMPGFFMALRNTLTMSIWKIVLGILVPVTFTLLLNEIANSFVKRGVQTLIYLPHFISWVLLAGIFTKLLSGSGIVNKLMEGIRLRHHRLSGRRRRCQYRPVRGRADRRRGTLEAAAARHAALHRAHHHPDEYPVAGQYSQRGL